MALISDYYLCALLDSQSSFSYEKPQRKLPKPLQYVEVEKLMVEEQSRNNLNSISEGMVLGRIVITM